MKLTNNLTAASCLIGLFILAEREVKANELRIPRRISCDNGSILIEQVNRSWKHEDRPNTIEALFYLTVNGIKERAIGDELDMVNYNVRTFITRVYSRNYYVYRMNGGLAFVKHKGKLGANLPGNEVICSNIKSHGIFPGFNYQY